MVSSLIEAPRYSLSDAAQLLGVHVSTLHRWRQRGVCGRKLRCLKIGPGKTAVLKSELEAFLASFSDPPSESVPSEAGHDSDRAAAADRQLANGKW